MRNTDVNLRMWWIVSSSLVSFPILLAIDSNRCNTDGMMPRQVSARGNPKPSWLWWNLNGDYKHHPVWPATFIPMTRLPHYHKGILRRWSLLSFGSSCLNSVRTPRFAILVAKTVREMPRRDWTTSSRQQIANIDLQPGKFSMPQIEGLCLLHMHVFFYTPSLGLWNTTTSPFISHCP